VLANNIANADTPNYKARDLDFASVLAAQTIKPERHLCLNMTNSRHIEAQGLSNGDESLQYRTPMQPSIDQNTVDAQLEQSNYAENAVASRPASRCSTANSKGWCQPCAESKPCPCQCFQHCRQRHERADHAPEHRRQ
jgi:flagellar basal-body rod protein FlgB